MESWKNDNEQVKSQRSGNEQVELYRNKGGFKSEDTGNVLDTYSK